jgi:hypothetical protein
LFLRCSGKARAKSSKASSASAGGGGGGNRGSSGGGNSNGASRSANAGAGVFRAQVEYVLQEDVTPQLLRSCVVDGNFCTSLCPLPLPLLLPGTTGTATAGGTVVSAVSAGATGGVESSKLGAVLDVDTGGDTPIDDNTRINFRPRALLRVRALAQFLGQIRPLHFEHCYAALHKMNTVHAFIPAPVTGAVPSLSHVSGGRGPAGGASSSGGGSGRNSSRGANGDDDAMDVVISGDTGSGDKSTALGASADSSSSSGGGSAGGQEEAGAQGNGASTSTAGAGGPVVKERRKYVFKNRPSMAQGMHKCDLLRCFTVVLHCVVHVIICMHCVFLVYLNTLCKTFHS